MKATRILSLVLALVMVLSIALVGCSGESGKKTQGDNPGIAINTKEETDQSKVYDAEIHDLHGHEFWFIVYETSHTHLRVNEVYAEELNGDKINDAVYKRNATLEEKYNCKIREERSTAPVTAVKEELIAGVYQYDYIYTSVKSLRPLSASNLLVDYNTLEEVDLSKAWWDQNALEGFTIAGKSFYAIGDGGTLDERCSWVLFWNQDTIERARLDSPYQLVYDGKWTVDVMYDYALKTWEDRNGDGVMEWGVDRFGWIGEELCNYALVAAANLKISKISSNGEITIPATLSDEVIAAWAKLKPLLTMPYRCVYSDGFVKTTTAFYIINLAVLNNITGKDINFGVLPLPKLTEEQPEYWTCVNAGWCYGYAIPTTTDYAPDYELNGFDSGREQAAYFIEAYSYYSMLTLKVAYYDQVVKGQAVRDAESADMVDLALKNKLYDPVALFNFGSIGTSLFCACGSNGNGKASFGTDVNYDTLVSLYESRVTAARKSLNNYINYISIED